MIRQRHRKNYRQLINGYKLSLLTIFCVYLIAVFYVQRQYVSGQYGATIGVWDVPISLTAQSLSFGSLFDTFDNHVILNTTQPVVVPVMDAWGWSNFSACAWIANHTDECLPGNTIKVYRGTKIDFWFNDSAGCSAYVYSIYTNAGGTTVIHPDVTAHYAPAQNPTGNANAGPTRSSRQRMDASLFYRSR